MAVFVVLAKEESPALASAVATHFANNHLRLNQTQWLISFNGTPKELSDRLKITEGESGSGIVVKTDGYYGRYSKDVWDWFKTKLEAPNG